MRSDHWVTTPDTSRRPISLAVALLWPLTVAAAGALGVLATQAGQASHSVTPPITVTSPNQPAEDEDGWNCLTMGNHECGEDTWWPLYPDEIAQLPATRDWTVCLTDAVTIVCPDGWVQDNTTVLDDGPHYYPGDEPWEMEVMT